MFTFGPRSNADDVFELFGLEFSSRLVLDQCADLSSGYTGRLWSNKTAYTQIGPFTKDYDNLAGTIARLGRYPHKGHVAACLSCSTKYNATSEEISSSLNHIFGYLFDFVDIFIFDLKRNCDTSSSDSSIFDIDALYDSMGNIMGSIFDTRRCYETDKPVLARLHSEMEPKTLENAINILRLSNIDGFILSGSFYDTKFIDTVMELTSGRVPLIASCGIDTPGKAADALARGVSMLQVPEESFRKIYNSLYSSKQ